MNWGKWYWPRRAPSTPEKNQCNRTREASTLSSNGHHSTLGNCRSHGERKGSALHTSIKLIKQCHVIVSSFNFINLLNHYMNMFLCFWACPACRQLCYLFIYMSCFIHVRYPNNFNNSLQICPSLKSGLKIIFGNLD